MDAPTPAADRSFRLTSGTASWKPRCRAAASGRTTSRSASETIDTADWERLRQAFAEQPVIAASLLAGRMPENIEDTFKAVGLSMFPARGDDLETDCSCPDWSNPCKHIAAVYLLLGEEFDRDPFLIFRMRGMDREDLLGEEFRQSAQTIEGPPLAPEPLPEDPDVFWANPLPALAGADLGAATVPDMHAALPQQLGRFPFWQGDQDLTATLEEAYSVASQQLYWRMKGVMGHGCYGGGKQRCGRCGSHGSGEVCGTVVGGRSV